LATTIILLQSSEILEVRLSGSFGKTDLEQARDSAARHIYEGDVAKVLVDMREANLDIPAYDIVDFVKPSSLTQGLPTATVAIVIEPNNENARFLETAASNRHSHWSFFRDREQALAYLAI
jgi:hypothetical protein